ncbi:MAG: hypothetical protein ACPLKZ_07425 [Candidatus Bathyarchaeales archaeon]
MIESQFKTPRRINKLTDRGVQVAVYLEKISENIVANKSNYLK